MERAVVYRTLEAKPTESSLIKPGELVDLVEMTPLTLNDRRIYNQLLAHAWDNNDRAAGRPNGRRLAETGAIDRKREALYRAVQGVLNAGFVRGENAGRGRGAPTHPEEAVHLDLKYVTATTEQGSQSTPAPRLTTVYSLDGMERSGPTGNRHTPAPQRPVLRRRLTRVS